MTIAEKLIAKGRAEAEARRWADGYAKGWAEGIWIGELHLLEEMMGDPVTPAEVLRALSLEELESRCREYRQRCGGLFKSAL